MQPLLRTASCQESSLQLIDRPFVIGDRVSAVKAVA